jgi:hypothetical protein
MMPYKHQASCYRTIGGVRWPNLCDVIDAEGERAVAEARAAGSRLRMVKHKEGFHQAFIHPDDLEKLVENHTAMMRDSGAIGRV